jgi:hypothetical protein
MLSTMHHVRETAGHVAITLRADVKDVAHRALHIGAHPGKESSASALAREGDTAEGNAPAQVPSSALPTSPHPPPPSRSPQGSPAAYEKAHAVLGDGTGENWRGGVIVATRPPRADAAAVGRSKGTYSGGRASLAIAAMQSGADSGRAEYAPALVLNYRVLKSPLDTLSVLCVCVCVCVWVCVGGCGWVFVLACYLSAPARVLRSCLVYKYVGHHVCLTPFTPNLCLPLLHHLPLLSLLHHLSRLPLLHHMSRLPGCVATSMCSSPSPRATVEERNKTR